MTAALRSRPLWLWAVTAFLLDVAGAQHVYLLPTVMAALLTGLALLWLVPASGGDTLRPEPFAPERLVALLPIAAFAASMVDVATFVPPLKQGGGWTGPRLWLLVGGIIALVLAARVKLGWVALAALVLGTIIRMLHMEHIQITPANGDMLPLVAGALDNLLAGHSPYRTYQMPWEVPLTYLPVTWLAYLPAYLLGVDLRWTNVAAELVMLGAVAWLAAERSGWTAMWRSEPALALWGWLYLQPSVIHWDTGNTAPITWALLAATLALVVAGRERLGALALGFTAAGTPLAAVFGPFIGLVWLRRHGWVHALKLAALSGLAALLIVLPFFVWAPQEFLNGTYRWFNHIGGWPRQKWLETDPHIWSVITGYSGEFWLRGTEGWLKPIQTLIVAGVALLFWRRGAPTDALCGHAAAAYLGFVLFNPVLWPYLYNPVLVAGLVGVTALGTRQALPERRAVASAEPRRHRASLT